MKVCCRLQKVQSVPGLLSGIVDYNSIDEAYRVKISNSCEALLVAEEEKSPNELWEDGKKIILR